MKPVNAYALTRCEQNDNLQRLERQMSGRAHFLTIKNWEIMSLRKLIDNMCETDESMSQMNFYYSFMIPKLGKEFDLLRIGEDIIINIELKSNPVSDESIQKQLLQNRYYLSALGKTVHSYTFISEQNRLVKLSNGNRIVPAEWAGLCEDIARQDNCYEGNIEALFKEESYIISPLTEPDRFLQKEYFLTSQQRDIEHKVLKRIRTDKVSYQGITGLPGTGKTLLLYDIAMRLSAKQKVCIFHCGSMSDELVELDGRLKRIDFFQGDTVEDFPAIEEYSAFLIDEAHRMSREVLERLAKYSKEKEIPMIFSYDCEDVISDKEVTKGATKFIVSLEGFVDYRLTNRIRANGELSSFIMCLLQGMRYNHRKDYPSVSVSFANNLREASIIIGDYSKRGYTYIYDNEFGKAYADSPTMIESDKATCMEFDKVVMVIDEKFFYDNEVFLRTNAVGDKEGSAVRNLFHGLNRAKNGLAIVVINNMEVFDAILTIVQGRIK